MKLILCFLISLATFCNFSIADNGISTPVVLWGQNIHITEEFPALNRLSTASFSRLIQKLTTSKPTIVLFLDNELKLEDLSSRDQHGKPIYRNLNAIAQLQGMEYLPSVSNPMKVIRHLEETENYVLTHYKDYKKADKSSPMIIMVSLHTDPLADRRSVLVAHDKRITEIYSDLAEQNNNLLAIYTSRNNVHRDINRSKRAAPKEESSQVLVSYGTEYAILASSMKFSTPGSSDGVELQNPTNVTLITDNGIGPTLAATFSDGINLQFVFTGEMDTHLNWSLAFILPESSEATNNDKNAMYSLTPIWAPAQWSYFCSKPIEFVSASNYKLVMTGAQIQPFLKGFAFDQASDCIPYFSSPIWAGILIVFLLLTILAWGNLMIMDINTMDRFDDPKGKTITITASE